MASNSLKLKSAINLQFRCISIKVIYYILKLCSKYRWLYVPLHTKNKINLKPAEVAKDGKNHAGPEITITNEHEKHHTTKIKQTAKTQPRRT